jgi:hypothetical protein
MKHKSNMYNITSLKNKHFRKRYFGNTNTLIDVVNSAILWLKILTKQMITNINLNVLIRFKLCKRRKIYNQIISLNTR